MQTGGTIANSVATGNVTGGKNVGGLVGLQNVTGNFAAKITGSHASGNVSLVSGIAGGGAVNFGGLVGSMVLGVAKQSATLNAGVSIDSSYATGTVTGTSATYYVGGLVGAATGYSSTSTVSITNSYASGAVSTGYYLGGLVGNAVYGTLSNVSASGNVTNSNGYSGGLVGQLQTSTITGGFATGSVAGATTGASDLGGLVGYMNSYTGSAATGSTITDVYASGAVSQNGTSGTSTGGLVGGTDGNGNRISNAYASGAVSNKGTNYTGGLVGYLGYSNTADVISYAYATGSVTGTANVGGLVGATVATNAIYTVAQTYASGAVSGTSNVGGLIGSNGGGANSSYYDSYSTGQLGGFGTNAAGSSATAVTSNLLASGGATAYKQATYLNFSAATGVGTANASGFVFAPGGSTRPLLAFEVPVVGNPMQPTAASGTAATIGNAHQLQLVNGYATSYNGAVTGATLAAKYTISGNIDLTETGANKGTAATSAGIWSQAGFVSLGTNGAGLTWDGTTYKSIGTITSGIYGFSGTFDGRGYTLSNLTINRSSTTNTGLFGTVSGSVSNLSVGGQVTGGNATGSVVGMLIGGPIGGTTGSSPVVSNVNSSIAVTGLQLVGGLVGSATQRSTVNGTASGSVTGTNTVGGLVGSANRSTVSGSASGAVNGRDYVGGLIGQQYGGTTTGFASGRVTGTLAVGGFIGVVDGNGTATTSSSNNNVSGPTTSNPDYGRVTAGSTAQTSSNF